jgi:dynein assembly factor 2
MDISKAESKLQKDIMKQRQEQIDKEKADKATKDAQEATQAAIEEDSAEEVEQRPNGIVQPKYKVVHTFAVNMMDAWEGHKGTVEEGVLQKKHQLPVELNVTIFATFADGMRDAKLDINESTLVFEYPNLYYLDLDLKYVVNPNEGQAKFDKTKKTLNIRLPVVGSTADSQKVIDRDYQEYLQREKERQDYLKRLEISKLEEEQLAKAQNARMPRKGDKENSGGSNA